MTCKDAAIIRLNFNTQKRKAICLPFSWTFQN